MRFVGDRVVYTPAFDDHQEVIVEEERDHGPYPSAMTRGLILSWLESPDDPEIRLVLADALDDEGRDRDAELLRRPEGYLAIRPAFLDPYDLELWWMVDREVRVFLMTQPPGFQHLATWHNGAWVE